MKPETKKAFFLFGAALGLGAMALVDLLFMPSSLMFYLLANAIFLFLRGLERLLTDNDPVAARLVGRSALVGAGGMLLLGMVSSLFALSGHSWFR